MKILNNNYNVSSLSHAELLNINGGTDRTSEGKAVGELVRKVIGGVAMLVLVFL